MLVIETTTVQPDESPAPMFLGGTVGRSGLVGGDISRAMWASLVRFAPGARTRLHTHDFIQVLYVTEGEGILATADDEHRVRPGMLIIIPPGESHWHGATAEGPFAHLGIGTHGGTRIDDQDYEDK